MNTTLKSDTVFKYNKHFCFKMKPRLKSSILSLPIKTCRVPEVLWKAVLQVGPEIGQQSFIRLTWFLVLA